MRLTPQQREQARRDQQRLDAQLTASIYAAAVAQIQQAQQTLRQTTAPVAIELKRAA